MSQLLQVGDRIDKYRVDQCIGVGGMGEVYLVTHSFLQVQRALKILRLDLIEDDPTFRDRFVREARIAARFNHPNSIGVVDVESESDSGFLYLVMEYVDGQSLHQYLQNGPFPEKEMLRICREVANVLDAAWREMQLVHRDIKPGNIMITRNGDVKLADLGIAKSSGSDMTIAYDRIESVEYRAEGVSGERIYGFASAKLLHGTFRNEELGAYQRYTYTGNKPCIVLRLENDIIVLGASDEQALTEIYDRISSEISISK